MTNGDIWLFQIDPVVYKIISIQSANITPVDCFGLNTSWASYDVWFGGQNNLVLLGYSYTPSLSLVKFSRKLDTGTLIVDNKR